MGSSNRKCISSNVTNSVKSVVFKRTFANVIAMQNLKSVRLKNNVLDDDGDDDDNNNNNNNNNNNKIITCNIFAIADTEMCSLDNYWMYDLLCTGPAGQPMS
jgi:hypothetical protein